MLVVLKPCTLLFCCGGYFIFYVLVLTLLLSGIFSFFSFLDAWMHLIHRKVLFPPFLATLKLSWTLFCFGGPHANQPLVYLYNSDVVAAFY